MDPDQEGAASRRLGAQEVLEIRNALQALSKSGLTLLMVEQKLDIALACAQRAYVLIKGRVALEETAARLARRADLADLYFSLATSAAASAPPSS
jgi:branched-chain amino acid transport system ATP-binding protein